MVSFANSITVEGRRPARSIAIAECRHRTDLATDRIDKLRAQRVLVDVGPGFQNDEPACKLAFERVRDADGGREVSSGGGR